MDASTLAPLTPRVIHHSHGLLGLLKKFEQFVGWTIAHPMLPVQIGVVMLISWGGLGSSLGLDDLFWHEDAAARFAVGLMTGTLFGQIWFTRYLLDRARRRIGDRWTLFPWEEPAIRGLGVFLLRVWPASLLLVIAPTRIVEWHKDGDWQTIVPMAAGLIASVGIVVGAVFLGERMGVRHRLQDSWLFRWQPGVLLDYLPADDHPLHAMAVIQALLLAAAWALALLVVREAVLSPVALLFMLLGVFNSVHGFIACQLRGFQYVIFAFLLWTAYRGNASVLYKLQLPNLAPYYDQPVRLDVAMHYTDHYRSLLEQADHSPAACGLVPSIEPVTALATRWAAAMPKRDDETATKPRLILVATSGGGIRAAVWTSLVLEGLEREIPKFGDHLRMVTGASGGMVGAGLYVADFEYPARRAEPFDDRTGLTPLAARLSQDSLSPAVQSMLLEDLPGVWQHGPLPRDRGVALEEAWYRHTRLNGDRSPLERSFTDLAPLERLGKRPSLVFTPMLVEDARRLVVSNLDLSDQTEARAPRLALEISKDYLGSNAASSSMATATAPPLSLSAVEFRRLFPKATGFRVGTAARMNAAFPFVSPGVNLPTIPPRRVVDAGYYDNYGVNVAALWLLQHEEELKKLVSGVLLVEVRAYRDGFTRRFFQDALVEQLFPEGPAEQAQQERKVELAAQGAAFLSTPAEAVMSARDRTAVYRNDELIALVHGRLNDRSSTRHAADPFFTTVAFECDVDAALSWTLPRQEAKNIAGSFYVTDDVGKRTLALSVDRQVERLKWWLGDGGGPVETVPAVRPRKRDTSKPARKPLLPKSAPP